MIESLRDTAAYFRKAIRDTPVVNMHAPVTALIGATCAGKSDVCTYLRHRLGGSVRVRTIPEVYTDLKREGKLIDMPKDASPDLRDAIIVRNQAQVAFMQIVQEVQASKEAGNRGEIVVVERGLLDGAAFFPGGPEAFLEFLGMTRERALNRYAAVIHLDLPTEHIYLREHPNNPTRAQADYTRVSGQHEWLKKMYGDHHRYRLIGNERIWEHKLFAAVEAVEDLGRRSSVTP